MTGPGSGGAEGGGGLVDRLHRHLLDSALLTPPGLTLVAVSGGPDSVALLNLLHALRDRLAIDLAVHHVDHGIRPESGRVADAVVELGRRLDIRVGVTRLRLGASASETRAREARYRALFQAQEALGARYLVTAHHADDQVETVLQRLVKGSGIPGLAGIPAVRDDGLVRPLLGFRKAELLDWLAGSPAGDWDLDPANADPRHDRSWIRTRLLPPLERRFGAAATAGILAVAGHAEAERRAWAEVLDRLPDLAFTRDAEGAGEGGVELARDALALYDQPLSHILLMAAAREAGCLLGPRRAARVLPALLAAPSGRRFDLGGGWMAETVFRRLRIVRVNRAPAAGVRVFWGGTEEGSVAFGRWRIVWRKGRAGRPERGGHTTWVTPGGMAGAVRGPGPGDRLRPLGGPGRRKVSRLLMEERVPRWARADYPVLEREGTIIWLPGVCRSDAAVPAPGTLAVRIDANVD